MFQHKGDMKGSHRGSYYSPNGVEKLGFWLDFWLEVRSTAFSAQEGQYSIQVP